MLRRAKQGAEADFEEKQRDESEDEGIDEGAEFFRTINLVNADQRAERDGGEEEKGGAKIGEEFSHGRLLLDFLKCGEGAVAVVGDGWGRIFLCRW